MKKILSKEEMAMGNVMKQIQSLIKRQNPAMLSAAALFFATVFANVRCAGHYHQPEFPESAKKLKRR